MRGGGVDQVLLRCRHAHGTPAPTVPGDCRGELVTQGKEGLQQSAVAAVVEPIRRRLAAFLPKPVDEQLPEVGSGAKHLPRRCPRPHPVNGRVSTYFMSRDEIGLTHICGESEGQRARARAHERERKERERERARARAHERASERERDPHQHRDRQTARERGRQTDRQAEKERGRETHIHTRPTLTHTTHNLQVTLFPLPLPPAYPLLGLTCCRIILDLQMQVCDMPEHLLLALRLRLARRLSPILEAREAQVTCLSTRFRYHHARDANMLSGRRQGATSSS